MPLDVDKFLITEKRAELEEIEERYKVKVTIIPDSQMDTPHYKIMRHKESDVRSGRNHNEPASVRSSLYEHSLLEKQNDAENITKQEAPAVPTVVVMEKTALGVFKGLWKKLGSLFAPKEVPDKQHHKTYRRPRQTFSEKTRKFAHES